MITVNTRGAREVERILSQIAPKEAARLVKSTVGGVASEVMKDAKRNMPRGTGKMKRLTKKRIRRMRRGIAQNDIVVGRSAFYWRFHEYGDGHVKRSAMFYKSINAIRPELGRIFERLFLRKLEARLKRVRNGPLRGRGGR